MIYCWKYLLSKYCFYCFIIYALLKTIVIMMYYVFIETKFIFKAEVLIILNYPPPNKVFGDCGSSLVRTCPSDISESILYVFSKLSHFFTIKAISEKFKVLVGGYNCESATLIIIIRKFSITKKMWIWGSVYFLSTVSVILIMYRLPFCAFELSRGSGIFALIQTMWFKQDIYLSSYSFHQYNTVYLCITMNFDL